MTYKPFRSSARPPSLSAVSYCMVLLALGCVKQATGGDIARRAAVNPLPGASSTSNQLSALNYLLFSSAPKGDQDDKLFHLLQDSNHSHVSDAVNLQLANLAWKKMHLNVLEYAQLRISEARPTINRLLAQANVSSNCNRSLNAILDSIGRLDDWAVQMYNAFGDFPATGLFEGSVTSMGSYHQCVDLEPNSIIERSQYCTFKFQPIVPKRPRYHNILAGINNLANFTRDGDVFKLIAKRAQYFYYTKMRLATCMPTRCSQGDLESIGTKVALNTYLQYSGVSCLEKQEAFNPDGAQVFALTILIFLASLTFVGTLVHILGLNKLFEPKAQTNKTDLNRNHDLSPGKGLFTNNQAVIEQALLTTNPQKSAIIPPTVIPVTEPCYESTFTQSKLAARIKSTLDGLVYFSVVRNGRKLFNTSSSGQSPTRQRSSQVSQQHSADSIGDQSDSSSVNSQGKSTDISCVHGMRFWTISWIIFGHTMQYTEWAGFARAYQVEQNICSFFLQPLLNATFSVDTFFLISGLLTTYVTWSITRGQYHRFSKFAFLISRYLRLTPQVMLVTLLFIVFPMMGDGPYWRGLVQKESNNCKSSWWVNALYLQAFIKQDQICNLVTWWLSIEMFYHFVSIVVIIALHKSRSKGILATLFISGSFTAVSCYLHFVNHYPPNMLPTLLQRYEVWDSIVLKYFWTPYPHAPAYFVGLLLGYILSNRNIRQLTRNQVRYGWLAFIVCYLAILFGTYNWNKNAPYSRLTSTVYYNLSQIFWALSTAWAILACALGHGGWLNSFLSSSIFKPLGRVSYMTYLSHMLIVISYPAKMNLLIEPSYLVFLYIFISNLFLSYMFGFVLTLVYESPILHFQKRLVSNMAHKFNHDPSSTKSNANSEKMTRIALYSSAPQENPDVVPNPPC